MDSLCNKMELNKGQSTAEKEVPMIAQMSRKSDIYHRPGCPYISRIHESHIEAFDMDDHKITHFQPCKYCCNMKTMYRKIQPNLPEIFGIFNYQTEYNGQYINVHTDSCDWRILLKASEQNMRLLREIRENNGDDLKLIKCDVMKKEKNLQTVIKYIVNQEKLSAYPEPFRNQVMQIKEFAARHYMEIAYDESALYILTDMAAWKIVYRPRRDWFQLFHAPFQGQKLTMEQAKTAYYHLQMDVPWEQSPYKHIKYIYRHDEAKKIEKEDYRNLPQKTKREKHYYQQAKRREQRKSARRVMNIFEQLERKEDIKQYSFW